MRACDVAVSRNEISVSTWGAVFGAVILTTHSMEEAEGLCDRLSIFVN